MRQFSNFCGAVSDLAGRPLSFIVATILIIVWCFSGPFFHYSDTWQLVINTSTTIITFLMVFLIQNTQNRESKAMQLKLDELIRSIEGAHNALLSLEELSTDEIAYVHEHYKNIAHQARLDLKEGKLDTGTPETLLHKFVADGEGIFQPGPTLELDEKTSEQISPSDLTNEIIKQHDQAKQQVEK